MFTMKDASFCPGGAGIAGYFEHPVSGDASQSDVADQNQLKLSTNLILTECLIS